MLAVYFANWSIYAHDFLPDKAPLDAVTHVIYAFFKPNEDTGTIELSDPWADVEKPMPSGAKGCIAELNRLKRVRGFRLLASVGGYTYSAALTHIFTSSALRASFVASAAELVRKFGFDGLDIDWEYPVSAAEGRLYVTVLQELRAALDEIDQQLELSIAAPAGEHILQYMPLEAMDRALSFWNVMTYDFAGGWSPRVEYSVNLHGAYPSCVSVIKKYKQHVPARKLLLGISLYKLVYPNASRLHGSFDGSPVQTPLADEPREGRYDKTYGCAYYIGQDVFGCSDCPESIVEKKRFCLHEGLGGAFFWDVGADRKKSLIRLFAER